MRYFRLVYRLIGLILIQILVGVLALAGVLVLLPFRKLRYRLILYLMNLWGKLGCWIMNFQVRREGDSDSGPGGVLIVSNHIGTVDIFVIAACFKTFFVSKSDVRSWPVIGQLAQLGGTIFIDRTRKIQVSAMVRNMTSRLESGYSVAVFPEGGTTLGQRVEPFKSSAFEAVIQSRRAVLPVVIRYFEAGEPSVACWPDEISFLENMIQLFMHPRLTVQVTILPEVTGGSNRRALAHQCRQLISEQFEQMK